MSRHTHREENNMPSYMTSDTRKSSKGKLRFIIVCIGAAIIFFLPIWHLRPVKPAKQEHVKEGFPVMQSSMQRPPFRQGLR